jgi:hypothetical protein
MPDRDVVVMLPTHSERDTIASRPRPSTRSADRIRVQTASVVLAMLLGVA